MRRVSLFVLHFSLLLLQALFAWGQEEMVEYRSRFRGGVMAGVVGSQVDGDGYGGYRRPNASVGVWVSRNMSERWRLRMELRYVGKGSLANSKSDGGQYKVYNLGLHYIELPLFLEYTFLPSWFAGVGVSGAYLAGYEESNAFGSLKAEGREQVRPYELGAHVRVGWRVSSRWTLRAGAGYSILPIRGRMRDVTSRIRTGQHNSLVELSVDFEI